jgi:hypothetical protein
MRRAWEWCVLTNGDEYRIYNTFAKAEAEKKVFRRVRLSDRDERTFCIDTLLLLSKQQMAEKQIDVLWKAHFVDRQGRVYRPDPERPRLGAAGYRPRSGLPGDHARAP